MWHDSEWSSCPFDLNPAHIASYGSREPPLVSARTRVWLKTCHDDCRLVTTRSVFRANYMMAQRLVSSRGPVAQSRRLTPTRRNTDSAADTPLGLAEPPKRTAEPAVECVQNARKSPGFKSPRARHITRVQKSLLGTLAGVSVRRVLGCPTRMSRAS